MEQATTVAPQELSNDLVQFTIHHKPGCHIEFEVQAKPSLIAPAKTKAIKTIAKEVTLPGFRKGKAPDALIVKNFSKELAQKWKDAIADLSFQECEKLAKIPLLSRETRVSYDMKTHSDQEAHLVLRFETEPTIPKVDPQLFHPTPIERPLVNEEKIAETIRQIRFFFATWHPVADRAIQKGDFILLDMHAIEQDPHTQVFSNTRFEVDSKYMAQWMQDLVIGKHLHDEVEGISAPDADSKDKENFKEQKVRLKIKAIEQCTLPELNEEFIQKLGVSSEEELNSSIEKLLNKQADEHVKEKVHNQVNEFLLAQYPFDLPPSLIEKEAQFRMRQLSQDSNFKKYWESLPADERKKTLQSIYQQSDKAVRMFYLCRKIIDDAHISIKPEDLPKAATTPLEILMDPDQMLNFHGNSEVKHAEALSKLVLEKAAEYVIGNSYKG
jgi:trigger factor